MMFQSGAGQIQNFDHRDMNNHAEIGNSVTHLAAPRKTYAPPRRPGTGKTYSETGRHAWGERTRPPKFIGKNRTYVVIVATVLTFLARSREMVPIVAESLWGT